MNSNEKIIQKALIYGTNTRGLLVFKEPQFPHIPMQVPGGTVAQEETPQSAAQREFIEETGLTVDQPPCYLTQRRERQISENGHYILERYFFHLALPDDLPQTCDHWELHAHDGAAPICFRFFWQPLDNAQNELGPLSYALGLIQEPRHQPDH